MPHLAVPQGKLTWKNQYAYQQCLILLIDKFCAVYAALPGALQPRGAALSWNGQNYHSALLQRRNVEFLVFALMNLAACTAKPPSFESVSARVQTVSESCPLQWH